MRPLLIFAALLVAVTIGAAVRDDIAFDTIEQANAATGWTQLGEIRTMRHRAQACAHDLTGHSWNVSTGTPHGKAYRRYVIRLWRNRLTSCRSATARANHDPTTAIIVTFGRWSGEALRVARCESHLHPWASNGQYLGMFQMGSSERRIYGHGPGPLDQARAAFRYFAASGHDWSPWSCKP